jgi:hypothetical protein
VAIVAGAILLGVAATLVTLAVARTRQPHSVETSPETAQPQTFDRDPATQTLQAR